MALGRTVALALVALVVPAGAQARPYELKARGSAKSFGAVQAIGDFKPGSDATLAAAIDVWGEPASARSVYRGTGCKVAWPGLGVRITFVNLGGGGSACKPDLGRAQAARVLRDERWHTARGLHVADGLRRLKRLYPGASRHGRAYWLVTGRSLFGPQPTRYAVLAATVRNGKVSSFTLSIGAAGE